MATTVATAVSVLNLYICYINRRKIVWQEVISSAHHKRDSIQKIVRSILVVCIPITITSILSVATKSIDAVTVVRMLQVELGEQVAQIQYGILAGKIDTLITLPFSFNIAFRSSVSARSSRVYCKWEVLSSKKKNRIFDFSNNTLRSSNYSYYECVFGTNTAYFVS